MASTYSDLKFELIGTGEQSGTWGVTTNTNLGTAIEEAITGSADVTFASAQVTLTLTDTNASQTARNLRLNLTGTSGGAQNLIVPAIEKFYLVNNGCADAITVKNSTGTGIAVPAGKAMLLFNDATNVVDAVTHMSSLTLASALAVASGGTGATTADGALTNLGGTTVGKGVFTAATAAAAQQAMDTEVGVDVQAYDAGLTDIAGLAVTDGNIIVGDGTNWVAESGATARTSLGAAASGANSDITSLSGLTTALSEAQGGTGETTYTDGQLLIGNTSTGGLTKATLTAGSGISVTNGGGSISLAASGGGGFSNIQAFTSSGTWTNPGSVTKVKVTVVGGGGGGGSALAPTGVEGASQFGTGGGGGGTAIEVITIPTSPVPVTVGAAGGSNTAGGTSSFSTYCSATGGSGGSPNTSIGYSSAGTGSGGDINITGSPGNPRDGGTSSLGGRGAGKTQTNNSIPQTIPGNPGYSGGGGGGAYSHFQGGPTGPSLSTAPGGSGGAGLVIVEW